MQAFELIATIDAQGALHLPDECPPTIGQQVRVIILLDLATGDAADRGASIVEATGDDRQQVVVRGIDQPVRLIDAPRSAPQKVLTQRLDIDVGSNLRTGDWASSPRSPGARCPLRPQDLPGSGAYL